MSEKETARPQGVYEKFPHTREGHEAKQKFFAELLTDIVSDPYLAATAVVGSIISHGLDGSVERGDLTFFQAAKLRKKYEEAIFSWRQISGSEMQ